MIERKQVIDDKTGELISEREQRVAMNKDFVQFYRQHLFTIAKLGQTDPLALAVWLWIVERMGRDNALVCSMAPLVEHFKRSRQTISKKVKLLRQGGYLTVAKTGTTNVYIVNAELVWTSNASQRRNAEFRASVVLSESEQTIADDGDKQGAPAETICKTAHTTEAKPMTIRSRRVIAYPAPSGEALSASAHVL